VALASFLVVTATTTMEPSAMWATTVTYGHLQRTVVTAPGTGTCTMVALPCTGTTAVSETGFQFVCIRD